jgi:hypothetical protein
MAVFTLRSPTGGSALRNGDALRYADPPEVPTVIIVNASPLRW